MSQELIYTSAPRGLKPGSRGFCTVVCTQGLSPALAQRLEALSGYRHVFPPQDANARLNPVLCSHLVLSISGRRCHVLSRICDAGLDYTQRTNKFAHHVVLDVSELNAAGPARLLSMPGFMQATWDGEPRTLPTGRRAPPADAKCAVCAHWQQVTGDAGWGGVLAETAANGAARPAVLIFRPGIDPLPLLAESLALLPPETRWSVSFSTYYNKMPPGVDCQWRCVLEGSPEAAAARRLPGAVIIDLCGALGAAPGGPYVEAARTGVASAVATAPSPLRTAAPLRRAAAFDVAEPAPAADWPAASTAAPVALGTASVEPDIYDLGPLSGPAAPPPRPTVPLGRTFRKKPSGWPLVLSISGGAIVAALAIVAWTLRNGSRPNMEAAADPAAAPREAEPSDLKSNRSAAASKAPEPKSKTAEERPRAKTETTPTPNTSDSARTNDRETVSPKPEAAKSFTPKEPPKTEREKPMPAKPAGLNTEERATPAEKADVAPPMPAQTKANTTTSGAADQTRPMVDLPKYGDPETSVTICLAPKDCKLELLGLSTALGTGFSFGNVAGQPLWHCFREIHTAAGVAQSPVAEFAMHQGSLVFRWKKIPTLGSPEDGLRNCLLKVTSAGTDTFVALRGVSVDANKAVPLQLFGRNEKNKLTPKHVYWDGVNLPAGGQLRIAMLSIDNLPEGLLVNGAGTASAETADITINYPKVSVHPESLVADKADVYRKSIRLVASVKKAEKDRIVVTVDAGVRAGAGWIEGIAREIKPTNVNKLIARVGDSRNQESEIRLTPFLIDRLVSYLNSEESNARKRYEGERTRFDNEKDKQKKDSLHVNLDNANRQLQDRQLELTHVRELNKAFFTLVGNSSESRLHYRIDMVVDGRSVPVLGTKQESREPPDGPEERHADATQ